AQSLEVRTDPGLLAVTMFSMTANLYLALLTQSASWHLFFSAAKLRVRDHKEQNKEKGFHNFHFFSPLLLIINSN
ncbi:hypothetical protein ACJX0J_025738, partial [Zea mays]